jgi:hypothetical protein
VLQNVKYSIQGMQIARFPKMILELNIFGEQCYRTTMPTNVCLHSDTGIGIIPEGDDVYYQNQCIGPYAQQPVCYASGGPNTTVTVISPAKKISLNFVSIVAILVISFFAIASF